jgi:hypothetical protein
MFLVNTIKIVFLGYILYEIIFLRAENYLINLTFPLTQKQSSQINEKTCFLMEQKEDEKKKFFIDKVSSKN